MPRRFDSAVTLWDSWRYALVRWEGATVQRRHHHPEPRIVLILDGRIEERVDGKAHACAAGTAIYRDAGAPHSDRYDASGAYVSIAVPARDASGVLNALRGTNRVLHSPAVRALGLRLANEICRPDRFSAVAAQALAFEAAALLGRSDGSGCARPAWLVMVLEMLRRDPGSNWSVERIAQAAGLGVGYVARAFRRHTGVGIAAHVRRIRLEAAQARLALETTAIAEIAAQTGFYDQSHLNRCFRQAFGLTPMQYRLRYTC